MFFALVCHSNNECHVKQELVCEIGKHSNENRMEACSLQNILTSYMHLVFNVKVSVIDVSYKHASAWQ